MFKGFYRPAENDIVFCLNKMDNLVEVKETLEREMVVACHQRSPSPPSDEKEVCTFIQACRQQSSVYAGYLTAQSAYSTSMMCAQVLFRERGSNFQQYPFDIWVRYADTLVKEHFDRCYSE